ncbi:hypothetical protein [Nodosilinea nodulosa]|uniref:hypothetical protein n=1 Tax=Nodosilinea nodulosa TaxID=416001 RepID=UPI0002FC80BB|nr:hypothetical protein [Nodosilinea nodulosa]
MRRKQSILSKIYWNVIEPFIESLSSLFERLPATPWGYGTFEAKDLLSDVHTQPFAEFLKANVPAEFAHLYHQTHSATVVVIHENQEVKWLESEIGRLLAHGEHLVFKFEQQREALAQENQYSPHQKRRPKTELERKQHKLEALKNLSTWISCGLSVLTFLGLCDLFELDVFQLSENPTLAAIFTLSAMSVSIGAKSQIAVFSERRFLAHARGSRLYPVFSLALISSLGVLFVAETGFALPGLLTIVNNSLDAGAGNAIAGIGAMLGAGLFSATNLGLGVALGWEEAELSLWIEMKEEELENSSGFLPPLTTEQLIDLMSLEIANHNAQIERLELQLARARWRFNRAYRRAQIETKRFNSRARRITRRYRQLMDAQNPPEALDTRTLPLIEMNNGK